MNGTINPSAKDYARAEDAYLNLWRLFPSEARGEKKVLRKILHRDDFFIVSAEQCAFYGGTTKWPKTQYYMLDEALGKTRYLYQFIIFSDDEDDEDGEDIFLAIVLNDKTRDFMILFNIEEEEHGPKWLQDIFVMHSNDILLARYSPKSS